MENLHFARITSTQTCCILEGKQFEEMTIKVKLERKLINLGTTLQNADKYHNFDPDSEKAR